MWMFFKREVMFFELPGAGGNDIFWAPRTVYFNLYAFCGASDINNFWKCLQYFIWMCFWFLYRNGSRSRSLNPSSLISLTLSLSLWSLSLSHSLSLPLQLYIFLSISLFLFDIFFFLLFLCFLLFFSLFLSLFLSFSLFVSRSLLIPKKFFSLVVFSTFVRSTTSRFSSILLSVRLSFFSFFFLNSLSEYSQS